MSWDFGCLIIVAALVKWIAGALLTFDPLTIHIVQESSDCPAAAAPSFAASFAASGPEEEQVQKNRGSPRYMHFQLQVCTC